MHALRSLAAGALVSLGLAPYLDAQTCNLGNPPTCTGCAAPCAGVVQITHSTTGANGSGFDFSATQYRGECGTSFCAGPISPPPLRFWIQGSYGGATHANSGCPGGQFPGTFPDGMGNYGIEDSGNSAEEGIWYLWQAGWNVAGVDGCPGAIAPAPPEYRTVAEFSFVDGNGPGYTGREGTVQHRSWYLVAAVDQQPGVAFDFERLQGGTVSTPATVCATNACYAAELVSAVTIVGRTQPCNGTLIPSQLPDNANTAYFDVPIDIANPDPSYYTEQGRNQGARLVEGYQIVYAIGAEPTTSSFFAGGWQPARDPTDPANLIAPVVPLGTTRTVVSVPNVSSMDVWLAARLIYREPSLNPTGAVMVGMGPRVASQVGEHCGPARGGPGLAVEFAEVKASRRGDGVVEVSWTTISEDDSSFFKVFRSRDAAGTEALVEAVPFVDAHGPFRPYSARDVSVVADPAGAHYYFVQEMTSRGPGDRSLSVRVEGASETGGGVEPTTVVAPRSSGGRSRR